MKKQKDFFELWATVTEACGENVDDAPFDEVCDGIFKNEYPDSQEAMKWLKEEVAKIQDQKIAEKVTMAAEDLVQRAKYFYLAVGFALGQDYSISRSEARGQIDYLRRKIREAGIFPLVPRMFS